jgi:hypothetical protein
MSRQKPLEPSSGAVESNQWKSRCVNGDEIMRIHREGLSISAAGVRNSTLSPVIRRNASSRDPD